MAGLSIEVFGILHIVCNSFQETGHDEAVADFYVFVFLISSLDGLFVSVIASKVRQNV